MATYYIDYNAADDSANGLTKGTPWKRQPYMQGWAGSYSHSAGDVFVFKGGVTWPVTCFRMSPASGTAGNVDNYTIDATWYMGGAWTQPVWDGEYANALTGSQNIVWLAAKSYIKFNNIEIKRIHCNSNLWDSLIGMEAVNHIEFAYLHLHGWALDGGVANDGMHGGICHSSYGGLPMAGVKVTHCEIENSELTGVRPNGIAITRVNEVSFCDIHDVASTMIFIGDCHDNHLYNLAYPAGNRSFDVAYHTNSMWIGGWNGDAAITTPAYVYNNRIHDVEKGSVTGTSPIYCVCSYDEPHDQTIYVFNNLIYGEIQGPAITIDPSTGIGVGGSIHIYNNTAILGDNEHLVLIGTRTDPIKTKLVVVRNNHLMGTGVALVDLGPVETLTEDHNLIQTAAAAAAQGYILGNLYAPAAGASTIDAGMDASAILTDDRLGVARPKEAAFDIGAYESNSGSYVRFY
jgi:hypothetical protein